MWVKEEEEETREGGSVKEFTFAWDLFTKSRLITKAEVPRFTPIGDKWRSFQCFEGHRERM